MVSVNMDASPVQSSSKCGSDFSIERLLSDDTKSRGDDAPEWLCCTRYRPPRLPRATVCRARRAGRHARVPFTAAQATALEAAYARAPYLAPPALRALAAALHLRDDRIKIWFQNRRARERREKNVNITPPNAMTLPPSLSTFPSNSWITTATRLAPSNDDIPRKVQSNGPVQRLEAGKSEGYNNMNCSMHFHSCKEESVDCNNDPDDGFLDIETVDD